MLQGKARLGHRELSKMMMVYLQNDDGGIPTKEGGNMNTDHDDGKPCLAKKLCLAKKR